VKIFVNANKYSQAFSNACSVANSAPAYVGFAPEGEQFLGSIDEVQLYNRALSDAEVISLYNSLSASASPSVVPTATPTIQASGNIIQTVAGDGSHSFCGEGTSALTACLNSPNGIYVNSLGAIFIADSGNNRIRKIETNGIITTFAGTGQSLYNGDSIPAISANLDTPIDVKGDLFGFIYITDSGNNRIRRVYNGIISTLIGNGQSGMSLGVVPLLSAINSPRALFIDSYSMVYFSTPSLVYQVIQPTPSSQPTSHPSRQPTVQPSRRPTRQPTSVPSRQPSNRPSSQPTSQPSGVPSSNPTEQPSSQPSGFPSSQPLSTPTVQPSAVPSSQPTSFPSVQPTSIPSNQPSSVPSSCPTSQPTLLPTSFPSTQPTSLPTVQPSSIPSAQPSDCPTTQPTSSPSLKPSNQPLFIQVRFRLCNRQANRVPSLPRFQDNPLPFPLLTPPLTQQDTLLVNRR
jgi:hypothetical protein